MTSKVRVARRSASELRDGVTGFLQDLPESLSQLWLVIDEEYVHVADPGVPFA